MRIGTIGCSRPLYYVIDGMAELPDACLCSIAPGHPGEDCSDVVANPALAKHAANYYSDYRQMLDDENLDMVAVNPFYYMHSAITIEALKRGLHVYCGKTSRTDPR